MSLGAVEDPSLSDEEIAQLRKPPQIVPPEPPPVYGPSPTPPDAPSFVDQVAAGPLPAGASTGAAGDAETAWPPPVPAEAPGMVPPAMPTPPGMQGTTPNMPSSVPGTPDQQLAQANQDVRAAATGAAKARTEADSTQMDALQGGADVAHERAKLLGDRRVDMQADQAAQQEAQDRFDEADKKAQEAVDTAANERKNFKFRDYWADKSSANKIGSALAVALGAFGAGLTKGPNYALQILDKSMDDDHRLQVEESQQLSDNEVRARTGLKDVGEARKQDLLNRQMNSALGDKLIATQLEEAAAKSTDANYQKNLNAYAAKLNSDSAQKLLETRAAVRGGIIKEQDDAAKRAEEAARTRLYNAQADAGGYARLARGHGGGGGGGGVTGDAVAQLKSAIEAGNNGKPLTAAEIQSKANELNIPAFAKTGRPSVEAITKSVAFVGNQAAKAGAVDTKELDKRMKDVHAEAFGVKGPGTQLERLNGMTTVVGNALKAGDKTAATAILEEAGGMLSGGKSTKTTVHLLEELRSTKDELEAKWGHLTGDPGASAAFTARLNGLLNRVKEEKRQELDQIRQRAIDTEMGEHGLARQGPAKERALGHLGMFTGITNDNGQPRYGGSGPQAPVEPKVTAVRMKDGLIHHFDAAGKKLD